MIGLYLGQALTFHVERQRLSTTEFRVGCLSEHFETLSVAFIQQLEARRSVQSAALHRGFVR
jgi:hypothetical protein